jgi:hypothetical protein
MKNRYLYPFIAVCTGIGVSLMLVELLVYLTDNYLAGLFMGIGSGGAVGWWALHIFEQQKAETNDQEPL